MIVKNGEGNGRLKTLITGVVYGGDDGIQAPQQDFTFGRVQQAQPGLAEKFDPGAGAEKDIETLHFPGKDRLKGIETLYPAQGFPAVHIMNMEFLQAAEVVPQHLEKSPYRLGAALRHSSLASTPYLRLQLPTGRFQFSTFQFRRQANQCLPETAGSHEPPGTTG